MGKRGRAPLPLPTREESLLNWVPPDWAGPLLVMTVSFVLFQYCCPPDEFVQQRGGGALCCRWRVLVQTQMCSCSSQLLSVPRRQADLDADWKAANERSIGAEVRRLPSPSLAAGRCRQHHGGPCADHPLST
jgi:hypothetical protein